MTQEQLLGYCAGFMDGEGTIIVGKSQQAKRNFPSYGLAIKVAQKEQEPLRLLQSLFGGTIYTTTRKGIRMIYVWSLDGQATQRRCLEVLTPLLICKKVEAEIALRFLSLCEEQSPLGAHLKEHHRAAREALYQASKNHRRAKSLMADESGQYEIPVTYDLVNTKRAPREAVN